MASELVMSRSDTALTPHTLRNAKWPNLPLQAFLLGGTFTGST